ncbi:MAG: protein adenylyltransferase SelO family protein [Myxococcota bacterium]
MHCSRPDWRQGFSDGLSTRGHRASHLRIGTLKLFAAHQEHEKLARLVQYALRRYYAEFAEHDNPAQALLDAVARGQSRLVAHWMSLGFVHGVTFRKLSASLVGGPPLHDAVGRWTEGWQARLADANKETVRRPWTP